MWHFPGATAPWYGPWLTGHVASTSGLSAAENYRLRDQIFLRFIQFHQEFCVFFRFAYSLLCIVSRAPKTAQPATVCCWTATQCSTVLLLAQLYALTQAHAGAGAAVDA